MRSGVKQALQFIVFFGLGIGLMWWQFSRFTPEQKTDFFTALKTADYKYFVLAIIIGALAHLSRAIRWRQTLHPLGHKTGLGNRFYAVMIGYLANYGIPRSGEFIRCGVLKTSDDVPFSEAVGTVLVERIVDTLCLALVFLLVLVFQYAQLSSLWIQYIWDPASVKFAGYMANTRALVIIGVVAFLVITLFFVFRKKIRSLIGGKLGGFLKGFKDGMLAVKNVPNPGWFIFHSLFIWAGYVFSMYACFFCFDVTSGFTFNTALILVLFGTFGVVFTPGGIGLYQIIITGIIAIILNLEKGSSAGAPFAWLSWGAQVGTVVVFCGVAAIFKSTLNKIGK